MNTSIYSTIMLVAGIGIPIMAALNSGLGVKLQSPVLAASILFSVGLILSISILLITEGISFSIDKNTVPWYFYLGGVFVIFYILSITWVAPIIGISNAVSFVLLGQLIAMSFIDHFGLLGALQYEITTQRFSGLALMAVGVLMVVNK